MPDVPFLNFVRTENWNVPWLYFVLREDTELFLIFLIDDR